MPKLFQSLNRDQKIDFFIQCQILMLKYHAHSSFLIREDTLAKSLEAFRDNIQKYQGYIYSDENLCILWNHIFVSDPKSARRALTENAYQEPRKNFNGISIDFFTLRKMEDCMKFIQENYIPQIEYILFIREGNPKLYSAKELMKKI